MHDWGFGWGAGMFFGPLFMIAGTILVIVLVVLLIRWLADNPASPRVRQRVHACAVRQCAKFSMSASPKAKFGATNTTSAAKRSNPKACAA